MRHTPGTEAGHHRAVWAPQRGCVWVIDEVDAVAFWQLWWSMCCPHALLNVARRLLDHTLIHPSDPWPLAGHPEAMKKSYRRDYFHTSAWKVDSANFVITAFSEVAPGLRAFSKKGGIGVAPLGHRYD